MPSVGVSSLISNLNPIRQTSSYTMPVLSPRHTGSTSYAGSYRSTFSSSTADRPYYNSYTSRFNSYTDRYTSRSYASDDTKKSYSRHLSNTDDITNKYLEDKSTRRDSLTRESSYREGSSVRSNSLRDGSLGRESSLSRGDSSSRSNLSALSVLESVADLRSKYSPANYVPAISRRNDNISRSKSINDIGRPPLEGKTKTRKVNETVASNSVAFTNNTNGIDDNGNRPSVAEIRKKFDTNFVNRKPEGLYVKGKKCEASNTINGFTSNEFAKHDTEKRDRTHKTNTETDGEGATKLYTSRPAKYFKVNGVGPQDAENKNKDDGEDDEVNVSKCSDDTTATWSEPSMEVEAGKSLNHTTDFASYISSKELPQEEVTMADDVAVKTSDDSNHQQNNANSNDDISTSPRLNRVNQNSANSLPPVNNLNSSSVQRSSPTVERSRGGREESGAPERPYPAASAIRNLGLNGLKNIGNTCFMNSVVQCLSNTRFLLEYVKEESYLEDINTSISSMKGALIKAFSTVIQELWSSSHTDRVVDTSALKSQIQRFAPRFMGYAQQDAQEFLRYLLEGLHEDVNRVKSKPAPILTEIDEKLSDAQKASESWQRYLRMDNSRVVDIFVGQLKSTLRCTHCGHCSVTFDPFWDLSLPIPQRQGALRLSQCLEHFTREETMDGDEKPTCSKCKERRKCTKSFSIQKFPKILVIHLKRFSPTERFRGKLSLVIDFPLGGLDMSAYAANKAQTDCVYNLYAISNHSGTTYSGHYTAYCKHPYSAQWHEYNDSRVSSISPKSVVSSEAYVLFYELVGAHPHL